jgi:GDP-4-dehydro-6-deoxy-D-mannose reductase
LTNESPFARVLITGISGSAASYLAEYILENYPGVEVHGVARWRSGVATTSSSILGGSVVHEADLVDMSSVLTVLQKVNPDAIFHLASHANVRVSYLSPYSVLSNNILGTSNLLEGVRLAGLDPVFLMCSTSEVYGDVDPKNVPINEDTPLRPVSPYAVSKVTQDLLSLAYFKSYGMKVIRTRMFYYLNPRRPDLFATSFARQVAWIERGLQETLRHGNLDTERNIIDVRDAVRAYWEAAVRCRPGEAYNIGGTTTVTVGEFLNKLIALAAKPIPTEYDPQLFRPSEPTRQVPCVDRFLEATGWEPTYTFEESLQHLLDHWRLEAEKEVLNRS